MGLCFEELGGIRSSKAILEAVWSVEVYVSAVRRR